MLPKTVPSISLGPERRLQVVTREKCLVVTLQNRSKQTVKSVVGREDLTKRQIVEVLQVDDVRRRPFEQLMMDDHHKRNPHLETVMRVRRKRGERSAVCRPPASNVSLFSATHVKSGEQDLKPCVL